MAPPHKPTPNKPRIATNFISSTYDKLFTVQYGDFIVKIIVILIPASFLK
jgi:hypothetical protein